MKRFALMVLVLAWLAAGCSGGSSSENKDSGNLNQDTTAQDTATDTVPQDTEQADMKVIPSDDAVLVFFDETGDDDAACMGEPECNYLMGWETERTLRVVLMENSAPLGNAEIKWTLTSDEGSANDYATLDSTFSTTDDSGIAAVLVKAKAQSGTLKLVASVPGTEISPLTFNIQIQPKVEVPLTVRFEHNGGAIFAKIKVYLFEKSAVAACADIDPNDMPTAYKVSNPTTITDKAVFNNLSELSESNPMDMVIVAVGYNEDGPFKTFGCDDENGHLEYGVSKTVTVELFDLPPMYAGLYRLTNNFDMISALPENVETVLNAIISIFNNPSAGILELACSLTGTTLSDFCGVIFTDAANPSVENVTTIGAIVTEMINAALIALLEDNIGGDILFTGQDVAAILKNLEIHSELTLTGEPDADGHYSLDKTNVSWKTLTFRWTLGTDCEPNDESCGLQSYSFSQIQEDIITASFEADIPGWANGDFMSLTIDPHSLNFKYGLFLNHIIEKMVLPIIGGDGSDGLPVVDTYEKLIYSLLGGKACLVNNDCCEVLADSAEEGWAQAALKSGCDAMVPLVGAYLRDQLIGLDLESGESFVLSTKEPCELFDNDGNNEVDAMGKKEPMEARCKWNVELHLNGSDATFDSTFYGTRDN